MFHNFSEKPRGDLKTVHSLFCLLLVLLHTGHITSQCKHGDVHLEDGANDTEGRVEVCANGQWGTVCDRSWDPLDAGIVCFQLGYGRQGHAFTDAFFGQGTGPIHLDDVRCTGEENGLLECLHPGLGTHNCTHFLDAGVRCNVSSQCNHGDLQLEGGASNTEGRVEVCANGLWGTVCDISWGPLDAAIVCFQLGYGRQGHAFTRAFFGPGSGPIHLGFFDCTGDESRLLECSHFGIGNTDYLHSRDAGVRCKVSSECTPGDLQLVGGDNQREGTVEVCGNGQWGTICGYSWDPLEVNAAVICFQLGYGRGGHVFPDAFFGQGIGPIHLEGIFCTFSGVENRLLECSHRDIGRAFCSHYRDVGVRCNVAPVASLQATPEYTSVQVSWEPPTKESELVTKYEVCSQLVKASEPNNCINQTNLTQTYTARNLQLNSTYKITVRAFIDDSGSLTEETIVRTYPIGLVTLFNNIPDITSILMSWGPPHASLSHLITEYEVCHDQTCRLLDNLARVYRFNNLLPNTRHNVTVRARINDSAGGIQEEMVSTKPIGQVKNVRVWVIDEKQSSVNVSWTRLDSLDVFEYQMSYNTTGASEMDRSTTVGGNISSALVDVSIQVELMYITFQISAIVIVSGERIQGPLSLVTDNSTIIFPPESNVIIWSTTITVFVAVLLVSVVALFICVLCYVYKKGPGKTSSKSSDHVYDEIDLNHVSNGTNNSLLVYKKSSIEHDYDQIYEFLDIPIDIDAASCQQRKSTRSYSLTDLHQFNQPIIRYHSLTNLEPPTSYRHQKLIAGPPPGYYSLSDLRPHLPPRNKTQYHSLSSLINNLRARETQLTVGAPPDYYPLSALRPHLLPSTNIQYHSLSSLINSLRARRPISEQQYQKLISIDPENMYQPLIHLTRRQCTQSSLKETNDDSTELPFENDEQDPFSSLSSFDSQNS